MKKELPTYEAVSAKLRHESGVLFWLVSGHGVTAGKSAGHIHSKGYLQVRIGGTLFFCHRIVWLLAHGEWPISDLDHINGNRSDNRLANLRLCTKFQNNGNRGLTKVRKHGLTAKGVTLHKLTGRFRAFIKCDGKHKYIGTFNTEAEASAAYDLAAIAQFREFARPNNFGLVG